MFKIIKINERGSMLHQMKLFRGEFTWNYQNITKKVSENNDKSINMLTIRWKILQENNRNSTKPSRNDLSLKIFENYQYEKIIVASQ